MEHSVGISESSSDTHSTSSQTKLNPAQKKKELRKWRIRTFLLIGTSLVLATTVALTIPLCIYGGCFSDDHPTTTTTPVADTTTTSSTAATTPHDPGRNTRTVQTKYGPVTGHEIDVGGGGLLEQTIYSYLGVPFAKPPVGPLRWKRTEEPEPWTEPYIADTLPNMCLQPPLIIQATHPGWEKFGEDCLYMQIYTPKDDTKGLYPVMLYIHGGAYAISGSIQYPGHYYAIRETIMIAINYRMGVFGFSSTDDPAANSNYGVWDMLMALKFVRENIEAFGGDPERITLFGESGGAMAVGLFILSPLAQGMFSQAILQSGTEFGPLDIADPDDGRNITFMRMADHFGCSTPTNEEMMDCMREIDADIIMDTNILCLGCRGNGLVIDGPGGIIPMSVVEMRDAGYAQPVPVIVGTNKDEMSYAVIALCPLCFVRDMNRELFETMIRRQVNFILPGVQLEDDVADDLYEALLMTYSPWPSIDNGTLNMIQIGHITSDQMFTDHTNTMLRYHCEVAPECYQYVYDVKITLQSGEGLFPRWMGVPHGMELPFLFSWPKLQTAPVEVFMDSGNMTMPFGLQFADKDRWWSDYSIDLWTNFAKYGTPTPDFSPITPPEHTRPVVWEKRTADKLWYFHIDNEHPETDPTASLLNFRPLETAFHHNYVPHVGLGVELHHDLYRRGIWPPTQPDTHQDFNIFTEEWMNKLYTIISQHQTKK